MAIFVIILIIGFFFIAIASWYVVIKMCESTKGEKLLVGSLSGIGCGLICLVLISLVLIIYDTLYEDVSIVPEHTDYDKARIIKENGKAKELYVTIDGEEYHFIFEEE